MTEIFVEKDNVNDDKYKVVTVNVRTGDVVEPGQVICELETSKSVIAVSSPTAGYISLRIKPGEEITVGQSIGVVAETPILAEQSSRLDDLPASSPSIRFTRAARLRIVELGLLEEDFKGYSVVSSTDVDKHYAKLNFKKTAHEDLQDIVLDDERQNIICLGGGGHAKMCLEILKRTNNWNVVGILDGGIPMGSNVFGVPVLGPDSPSNIEKVREKGVKFAINGIGMVKNHKLRYRLNEKLTSFGYLIPNVIHPSAIVEDSSSMGYGNQIMAGAIVGSGVKIGNNCIINSGAIISHDSHIADEVHVAPGAVLAGLVSIERGCLIGMGVTVSIGVKIKTGSIVPNGTSVFKDIN